VATGAIKDPDAAKSRTSGWCPGGEMRGGGGVLTTLSSIRASSSSSKRSKSFICSRNASCKRSTHTRVQPLEGGVQNLGCGAWDVGILVDPVSTLDQLQPERSRAQEPDREPQKTTPHSGAVRGLWCRKHSGSRAQGCC